MPLYVDNADIEHHWIGTEDKFWYRRTNAAGEPEFVVIDAATGQRSAAFDPKIIADGLSEATKNKVEARRVAFQRVSLRQRKERHRVSAGCRPLDLPNQFGAVCRRTCLRARIRLK